MSGSVLGKLVLMDERAFVVSDESGEIGQDDPADGLYHADTRYLSLYSASLNGAPLSFMAAPPADSVAAHVILTNGAFALDDGRRVPPQTIAISRLRYLDDGLRERFELTSYLPEAIPVRLELSVAADFRDMFDIRGFAPAQPGKLLAPLQEGSRVRLRYRGRDGVPRETWISTEPPFRLIGPPHRADTLPPSGHPVVRLPDGHLAGDETRHAVQRVDLALEGVLEPGVPWSVFVTIHPVEGTIEPARRSFASALEEREARRHVWLREETSRVTCSDPAFSRLLERSASDLHLLTHWPPGGPIAVAGIPWFAVPFGRDAIVTAIEAALLFPGLAAGTLRFLAAQQGTQRDDARDEDPGKIMHELRGGELARLGEVPFTPYYGSVDATPLFLMLLGEADRWLGDDQLLEELWPSAERALAWIEGPGDLDDDGFLEYATRAPRGIRNQGWKDSDDAITHADGRLAEPPIALIEVQAYAYAARRAMARLARRRGADALAERLERDAETLRRRVREHFWLDDLEMYAQALDRDKRPVAVASSNAAHALAAGLATAEEAARMAARLARGDLLSGWGLRTLSSGAPSYNPMSYHNGSIWPHDNALAAAGLAAYGHDDLAITIVDQVVTAARGFRGLRLPELYCGFARTPGLQVPAAYPVSCSPQAWAAAAPFLMLRALLGLEPDAPAGRISLRPRLPAWLDWVQIENLAVGRSRVGLRVCRRGDVELLPGSDPIDLSIRE